MRRLAVFLALVFGLAVSARAQNTVVQATIVDPMGNPYTFGTGGASLVCPGNAAPTHNGTTVNRNYPTFALDGNGHFQQTVYDVNQLDQSGCAYRWTITWKDGVTTFIAPNIGGATSGTPITGPGPVNISAPINAFAVPLPQVTSGVNGSGTPPQLAGWQTTNTLNSIAGSSANPVSGAITLSATSDATTPLTIGPHSITQSADLFHINSPTLVPASGFDTNGNLVFYNGGGSVKLGASGGTPCILQLPSTTPVPGQFLEASTNAAGACQTTWTTVTAGGGTIIGAITPNHLTYASGSEVINDVPGSAVTPATGAISLTPSGVDTTALTVNSTTADTSTTSTLTVAPTWNTSGVVDAGILETVTNTASGTGSKLIDLKVGATSEFNVDKTGTITLPSINSATIQAGTSPLITTRAIGGGNEGIFTTINSSSGPNLGIGASALVNMTSGGINVAVGPFAGQNCTTCSDNVLIGHSAGLSITTGGNEIAIGFEALQSNTIGTQNIAVGDLALQSLGTTGGTGTSNIAIGYQAGQLTGTGGNTSTDNIFIGQKSGTGNSGANSVQGSWNTILGEETNTTAVVTTGSHNVVIGSGLTGITPTNSWQFDLNDSLIGTGLNTPATSSFEYKGSSTVDNTMTVAGTTSGAATTPTLKVTPTWNTSGVVDAGIFENVTDTASGTGSLLLDLQDSGASKFSVDKTGLITDSTFTFTPPTGPATEFLSVICNPNTVNEECGLFNITGTVTGSVGDEQAFQSNVNITINSPNTTPDRYFGYLAATSGYGTGTFTGGSGFGSLNGVAGIASYDDGVMNLAGTVASMVGVLGSTQNLSTNGNVSSTSAFWALRSFNRKPSATTTNYGFQASDQSNQGLANYDFFAAAGTAGSAPAVQYGAGEGVAPTGIASVDELWADSTAHRWRMNNNNGGALSVDGQVCSGQIALTTAAIASGTRATNTLACTGLSTATDSISCTFNSDTNAVTGYAPSASGGLTLKTWVSTNTINVDQVNNTGGSITPGAATLNCKGIR